MEKEILYYEVTHSYGGIQKGLRFQVEHTTNRHIDISIKEGLVKATGKELRLINLSMLKCKKMELDYLMFEVTQRCNLNCKYCYNHWKARADTMPENHSYAYVLKTLKKAFKHSEIRHITFTGGEPFLFDRLEELVLFCRMKGASVSIITNGNSGRSEQYAELIRLRVDLFELPLHSAIAETHDRMTGVIGSWYFWAGSYYNYRY